MTTLLHFITTRSRLQVVAVGSVFLLFLVYYLPRDSRNWPGVQLVSPGDTQQASELGLQDEVDGLSKTSSTAVTSTPHDDYCARRFDSQYYSAFSRTATSYCDDYSTSNLTCFSHKISKKTDSFCVGGPMTLTHAGIPFHLDCALHELSEADVARGVPRFADLPWYWYNTGPRAIFDEHIELGRGPADRKPLKNADDTFAFFVQRENNNQNLWHTMMEIMSLTMSLDILRENVDPGSGRPFFTDADVEKSQVIILDKLEDGPYYDLWSMFSSKPTIRESELVASGVHPARVVVPLPGSSNPFWQGDWLDSQCGESHLLQTFSRRVLDFYGIPDPPASSLKPLTLTFVDRTQKRRLLNQEALLPALAAAHPDISIQVVDFAALSLSEQIRTAHSTDILVGVHGAGLTHGMFQPHNATLVEILPPMLVHKGFHMMVNAMGNTYFSQHGRVLKSSDVTGDWQQDDVYVDQDDFLSLMDDVIMSARRRR